MERHYYPTVYVVGNGLDLSCGFKTSYSDFMESLNGSKQNRNSLMKYLTNRSRIEKWIDLEVELTNYVKLLREPIDLDTYKSDVNILKVYLQKYLDSLEWTTMDISLGLKLIDKCLTTDLYILNFNYSNTIESYIQSHLSEKKNYIKINHIHGTLEDNDMIIGVQDNVDLPKKANFLYKSRHVNPQKVADISNILKRAEKIIFFGYSLGETDHSYFDFLFETQSANEATSKNFIFYHYGDDARNELDYNLRMLTKKNLNHFYANNNVEFKDCKN